MIGVEYHKYIKSETWFRLHDRVYDYYIDSWGELRCWFCDCLLGEKFQLHHRRYDNLGRERFEIILGQPLPDVVPVCNDCHKGYHNEREKLLAEYEGRLPEDNGIPAILGLVSQTLDNLDGELA